MSENRKKMGRPVLDVETSEWSLISIGQRKCHEYVYIVHCLGTDYYKIGISTIPPLARLANLQTGCPMNLSMIHVFANLGAAELEREIHARLRQFRMRGEWFKLSKSELDGLVADTASRIGATAPVLRMVA